MPETQIVECAECGAKIRLSVRDDGEVTVLDVEEANPLEGLREL